MRLRSLLLPACWLVIAKAQLGCDNDATLTPGGAAGNTSRPDATPPSPRDGGTERPDPLDADVAPADADADGGDDADAQTGAVDRCEQAEQAFVDFVAANQACSRDSDCTMIGDCSFHADFTPINVAAAEMGQALMSSICNIAIDGPTYDVTCQNGACVQGEENGCCGCPTTDAGSTTSD